MDRYTIMRYVVVSYLTILCAMLIAFTAMDLFTAWSLYIEYNKLITASEILSIALSLVLMTLIIYYGIFKCALRKRKFTLNSDLSKFSERLIVILFWLVIYFTLITLLPSIWVFIYGGPYYYSEPMKIISGVLTYPLAFAVSIGVIEGVPIVVEKGIVIFDWLRWRIIPKEIKTYFPLQLSLLEDNDRIILTELGYDYEEKSVIEGELRREGIIASEKYSYIKGRSSYEFIREGVRLRVKEHEMYIAKLKKPRRGTLAEQVSSLNEKMDKVMKKLGI